MDSGDVVCNLNGQGKGEGPSVGFARSGVLEGLVLGSQHFVGLGNRDGQREPVASRRRDVRDEVVRGEPCLDSGDGLSSRRKESIDLENE
jgi:hypothetical protein